MPSLNKVTLIGHLGSDPEIRQAGSSQVCQFSLATSEQWKDKNGEKQEKTEWHRVQCWAKLAELCAKFLRKGRLVYIEGRIQTRKWQDKDGKDRYTTEIVANQVLFLSKDPGGGPKRDDPFRDSEPEQPASGGGGYDDGVPF